MPHVFISYVHENWDAVQRLCNALKVYEVEVWLDREHISPGTRWTEAIRDAISQGAFFIACFSEEHNKKNRSYMNEEILVAIEELRLRPFDRAWFIPVLLSKAEMPNLRIWAGETLRSIQWVDLSEDWNEGIKRILHVIRPDSCKVYELIQALNHKTKEIRIKAAKDLWQIGMAAKNAIPALLDALEDEDETVRTAVLSTLRNVGFSDYEIVSKIVSIYDNTVNGRGPKNWERTLPASSMLVHMGSDIVPAIIEEKDKPHKDKLLVGDLLHYTLVQIGASAIPALTEALDSASHNQKKFILRVLGNLRKEAQPAVSSILRILKNESGDIKSVAIDTLAAIADPSVVPVLIALLDYDVSHFDFLSQDGTAAQALASIGDPVAIPAIIQSLKDRKKSVLHRSKCAAALSRFDDPSVVPILIDILLDVNDDVELRGKIIGALEDIWEFRSEAIKSALKDHLSALIKTMQTDEPDLRFYAARAVWRIDGNAKLVVPVIVQGLKDYNPSNRSGAARILKEIGSEAIDAVPVLIEALKDREDFVREAALEALKSVDPQLGKTL